MSGVDVSIEFKSHTSTNDHRSGGAQYFTRYHGKIYAYFYDDSANEEEVEVGHIDAIMLQTSRLDEAGLSYIELADEDSQELYDYVSAVYDIEEDFQQNIIDVCGDTVEFTRDLFILTHMEIHPDYRGTKIGLYAMNQAIQQLGWHSLCVIKPYPLQFIGYKSGVDPKQEEKWNPQIERFKYPKKFLSARKKLIDYYKKLGFKRVPNSEYMVCIPFEHLKKIH